MFANRFTAVLDACVLVPALTRNLLLSLAAAELYRPVWSEEILGEAGRAIEKLYGEPAGAQIASNFRVQIASGFPEGVASGRKLPLDAVPELPDPDDRHVVLTALQADASLIVTNNIADFPETILTELGLEAKSADAFLADTLMLPNDSDAAILAVSRMLQRYKRPELTVSELLVRMERNGLIDTAAILADKRTSL